MRVDLPVRKDAGHGSKTGRAAGLGIATDGPRRHRNVAAQRDAARLGKRLDGVGVVQYHCNPVNALRGGEGRGDGGPR